MASKCLRKINEIRVRVFICCLLVCRPMCTTCYIINLSEDFGYKGHLDTDDFAGYKLLCLPLNLSYCRVLTYCEIYIAAKFNTVIATGGVPRAAVCTRLTALGKGVRTYREGV